jgi:isopenicillin N synthase-like dioxygenase
MTQVGITLLRAFAEALRLPLDAFDGLYGDKPNEHIKLIRYPGQQETQSAQGVGAHKDSGFLSFLLQDEQKGLQVEVSLTAGSTRPRWRAALWSISASCWSWQPTAICAQPCTGSFRRPPTSACRSLSSSAPSWMPWSRLHPADELAREALGPDSDPQNPLLREVGWNYLKGRLRSHPDVAERYYQDVFRERAEQLIVRP